MSAFEADYSNLVDRVMNNGVGRNTRAGPTRQLFGQTLEIDCLRQGYFPILTQRKIFYKPVLGELAAFLRGATDLQTFKNFGCNYWDANAAAWKVNEDQPKEMWDVGNIYGNKWRWFNGVDQLAQVVNQIKYVPDSRRILLTAYDPAEEYQCLPPCHLTAQFNCAPYGYLDCTVYMRSVDLCLGLPSDIILYAVLLLILCQQTQRFPGTLTFMLGDTHIYENHVPIWKKHRDKKMHELPRWGLSPDATIDTFVPEHLTLLYYQHGEKLEYPFAA